MASPAHVPCAHSASAPPQDSTFEFEKRRNRPVKYDRELMGTTLQAVKRVGAIQRRREERYHAARMRAAAVKKAQEARVDIERNVDLIAPAASRERAQVESKIKAKAAERANAASKASGAADEEE